MPVHPSGMKMCEDPLFVTWVVYFDYDGQLDGQLWVIKGSGVLCQFSGFLAWSPAPV